MNDSHREQRPLLCDDYSDDEFDVKNYNYQKRNRHTIGSGRARNYAKGTAAIFTRWPDNCSSSVAYWWLGVSMIAITIFVIYNSVLIFGMIPTPEMKPPKFRVFNNDIKPKVQALSSIEVYMHIVINNDTDIFLNRYLPYVKVISKKYPKFKYKFLMVLNDTLIDFRDYKDQERNEIAFNSLWTNKKNNRIISSTYNISVEYVSLTDYLSDSPIRKFWRHIPPHLIEFLVRAVSIWDKGGIAFNPKILIPELYSPHYVEKLHDIFSMYANSSTISAEIKTQMKLKADVNTRRPNNIQDIINSLTKVDSNISNIDLSEAENKNVRVESDIENVLKLKRAVNYDTNLDLNVNSHDIKQTNDLHNKELSHIKPESTNNTELNSDVLPLLLKYLFNNKTHITPRLNREMSSNNASFSNLISQNQSLPVENLISSNKHKQFNNTARISKDINTEKPIESLPISKTHIYNNVPNISVDIKGNIIATRTACHAFLGTIFSSVFKVTEEETLTDFIISELSLFCNGMLTSCAGVNVILI